MTTCSKGLRRAAWVVAATLSLGAQGAELTVSAASSLTQAFKALVPGFESQHPGTQLLLNFAASDALLVQIARGAPVDVFASADQETMDRAQAQGLLRSGTRRNFTGNRLVLVTPVVGGVALQQLAELQRPAVQRMVLGKPEGVPAGRYAKQALTAAGLWEALAPKAVYATHVRQALDYVARGEVDAGFVYASDAAAQNDKVKVLFSVPTPSPIVYPVATLSASGNPVGAQQFIDYLASPPAQALLARFGFIKP